VAKECIAGQAHRSCSKGLQLGGEDIRALRAVDNRRGRDRAVRKARTHVIVVLQDAPSGRLSITQRDLIVVWTRNQSARAAH
jgi:hypothetical protein